MEEASEVFALGVGAILERYLRQNGRPAVDETELRLFAERLWKLTLSRGLPRPLGENEIGKPGEMDAAEVAPLLADLLTGLNGAEELAKPARQLIKACFHPEFRTCRESYREREADGTSRRQQLEKTKTRVSGAHCVDCPYWTSLTREEHERCLNRGWAGDVAEFVANREIFLPEDFRALRRLLHAESRNRVGKM